MANSTWLFILIGIAVIFPLVIGSIAPEFGIDYVFPIEEVSGFGFDYLETSEESFIVSVLNKTLNVVLFLANILIMFFGFLGVIINNFIVVIALLPVGLAITITSLYLGVLTYIVVKMLPTT